MRGSRPAMFGPLWLLQRKQASARFRAVVRPLCPARNDVVNLKGEIVVFLWHLAVLANAPSAPPDQLFKAKVHSNAQWAARLFLRALRALDFMSD
ncbi:MAG: hypothetical protein ACRD24_02855, partial [Terriglobales bacterium]